MRIIDYETLAFSIEAENFENSVVLLNFADEANIDVKFKVMETDERGKDIYSVMANGHKLGIISKADREMFEQNIKNATSAKIEIHPTGGETDASGCNIDAILRVPYVIAPKDIQERVKKREKAIILAILLLVINAAMGMLRAEWVPTLLSILGAGAIYVWAFVKKSGKCYDFIMKEERKIIDLF